MHAEPTAYDPGRRIGGGAAPDTKESDSDSAGRFQIHATHSLRLHMPDGVLAVQYGAQIGWPWMNTDGTVIEIPAAGRVRKDGEWKSGEFLVVIKGKRLTSVFDHIAEARRLSVKPTPADVPEPKPVIESITVEPHELD